MSNIDNLVDQLSKLTVVEAGELSKKLEKAWNLDLAALTAGPAQPATAVEEESNLYDVILTSFDADKKIAVLKKCREYNEMGLLEAKTFVENCPSTLKEDIEKEEAEKIRKEIEAIGGKVEIK